MGISFTDGPRLQEQGLGQHQRVGDQRRGAQHHRRPRQLERDRAERAAQLRHRQRAGVQFNRILVMSPNLPLSCLELGDMAQLLGLN